MKDLTGISVYYLILEALNDGNVGLLPLLEPIPWEDIVFELKQRTGLDYGNDSSHWARWFLGNDEWGSELERANLSMFLQTQESMTRIWQKLLSRPT